MGNRLAKNRKSPINEDMYIQEYLKKNPSAEKADGLDIAAVITKDGVRGMVCFQKNLTEVMIKTITLLRVLFLIVN